MVRLLWLFLSFGMEYNFLEMVLDSLFKGKEQLSLFVDWLIACSLVGSAPSWKMSPSRTLVSPFLKQD